ncbi:hypothetical protein EVA_18118 [gut metagenome]|uniref:Uncharacterized protein n=1 Tax=gut metagenome TaxID=749906 RepID=J9FFS8_9ZZZZ
MLKFLQPITRWHGTIRIIKCRKLKGTITRCLRLLATPQQPTTPMYLKVPTSLTR